MAVVHRRHPHEPDVTGVAPRIVGCGPLAKDPLPSRIQEKHKTEK